MFEYLLLAEELGAAPVWVANNGVSHQQSIAPQDLGPWIQSALNSLEFAMGGPWTPWGAVRREMGHPAPFHISHFAIGNEVGAPAVGSWGPLCTCRCSGGWGRVLG